ncbi:MAG: hypothetical protein H8E46_12090 [FCB group bacterium]|nr:hypothetical protein [FCB group bacterium]
MNWLLGLLRLHINAGGEFFVIPTPPFVIPRKKSFYRESSFSLTVRKGRHSALDAESSASAFAFDLLRVFRLPFASFRDSNASAFILLLLHSLFTILHLPLPFLAACSLRLICLRFLHQCLSAIRRISRFQLLSAFQITNPASALLDNQNLH